MNSIMNYCTNKRSIVEIAIDKIDDKLVLKNYDYNFLNKSISYCKKQKIETLITGLSYSFYGINDKFINKSINLSLPSQDLYYSSLIIKKIVKQSKSKPKYCILGMCYYIFNFDLSRCKGEEIKRLYNIYYPTFSDSHNHYIYSNFNKYKRWMVKGVLIFSKKIYNAIFYKNEEIYYFNGNNTRENVEKNARDLYNAGLEAYDEEFMAKDRANQHNKLIKYNKTLIENINIFNDLIKFFKKYDIIPILVVFPHRSNYKRYLDSGFREIFYNAIKSAEYDKLKIIDLFNSDEFEDDDFFDADHLNERGCSKLTNILKQYIENI